MTGKARIGPTRWNIYRSILNLLFPPRCVACRRGGSRFCADCLSRIEKISTPLCLRCGRPLQEQTCTPCSRFPLTIDGLRAVAYFEGGLRLAIHRFKYRHDLELAPILADLLEEYLNRSPIPFDVIMPVPLHPDRERARGYNQSFFLAREIAARRSLPLWYNKIRRVRATRPQIDLDLHERFENVRHAFIAEPTVAGMRVLLIDDVCTTGATLDACAAALKERGTKSVWGLTLARGR